MKEKLTVPDDVIDLVNNLTSEPVTAHKLSNIKTYLLKNVKITVSELVKAVQGRPITIILDSILKEIANYKEGDRLYLDKYLIDNKCPIVNCNIVYNCKKFKSLKKESLYFLEHLGVRDTVLLYGLIVYHKG